MSTSPQWRFVFCVDGRGHLNEFAATRARQFLLAAKHIFCADYKHPCWHANGCIRSEERRHVAVWDIIVLRRLKRLEENRSSHPYFNRPSPEVEIRNFSLNNPNRVVIELAQVGIRLPRLNRSNSNGLVKKLRAGQYAPRSITHRN